MPYLTYRVISERMQWKGRSVDVSGMTEDAGPEYCRTNKERCHENSGNDSNAFNCVPFIIVVSSQQRKYSTNATSLLTFSSFDFIRISKIDSS